jgi:hypothetical protein
MSRQSRPHPTRRTRPDHPNQSPPVRTRLGLAAEMIAQATGQPIERCQRMLADFSAVKGKPPGDRVMTEAEYESTRESLRAELPGIRTWLVHGAIEAAEHPDEIAELQRVAASRN